MLNLDLFGHNYTVEIFNRYPNISIINSGIDNVNCVGNDNCKI